MTLTKNKEEVLAIRAMKYKKYVAGKYTRARHLWCGSTQIEYSSQRWHNKYDNSELY